MQLLEIPITSIDPDPDNVRADVGDIADLTSSIKTQGILEPLLVIPVGEATTIAELLTRPNPAVLGTLRWALVCGHRRLAAADAAGITTVPCVVRTDLDDVGRLEAQIVENLHRSDLSPVEEARAFRRLIDLGVSQRKLTAKVGRSQGHISKRLTLLTKLPDWALDDIHAGKLTVTDGLELAKLDDHDAQADVVKAAKAWGSIESHVQRALADAGRKRVRAEAIAKLKAEGATVIDEPKSGYYGGNIRPLSKWYWNDDKPPTRKQVENAGVLAAAVDERGTVTWVCTDVKRFERKTGTSTSVDTTKADKAKRRAFLADKRAAATARNPAVDRLLDRRTMPAATPAEIIALLATGLVDAAGEIGAKRVVGLLGCPIIEKTYTAGGSTTYEAWHESLMAYAKSGPEEMLATAVALAVSDAEKYLTNCDEWEPRPNIVAFFDALACLEHHQLHPLERQALRRAPGTRLIDLGLDESDPDDLERLNQMVADHERASA